MRHTTAVTKHDWVEGPDPGHETELFGGVETRTIVVVPYRPEWPGLFRRRAERIAAALGEVALQFEHIGSTAVPGPPRSRSLICWSWSRIPAMRTRICRPWKAAATCSGCESPSSTSTGCSAQRRKMCTSMFSRAVRRRSGATSVFGTRYAATSPFGRSTKDSNKLLRDRTGQT